MSWGAHWLTIPEWRGVQQINVFHREQDTRPLSETGAPQNLHVLVRGGVALPPGQWVLRLSADDYYHAWLDGEWLGQGPAPSVPEAYCYQEYSVEGGRTVTLALHLYYQGLINRVWNSGDGRFGMCAAFVQGRREIVPSGWRYQICRAYSGEPTGYETQYLENFDSCAWPEGWETPDFDDSDWGPLVPASFGYRMERQETAPLARYRTEPVTVQRLPEGFRLDFGRELTGTLDACARGPEGARVVLRFGEELDENGRVRYEMRCNCRYEEVWTLAAGENRLHPFDYKAFRYAEVLFDGAVTVSGLGAWVRHYPMDDAACTLDCEEGELGKIFAICKHAVRCGTQEGYLDCPTREKGQYLGDAVVTARSQVWLTGSTGMLRKCIRDFMQSQRTAPGLLAVAPGSLMQEIADFSLLFPLLPLTDYEFTGDRDFLQECYPAVRGVTDYFARYARADGLLENVTDEWNLVDWPENLRDGYDFPLTRPVVGKGCHAVINALWCGALQMQKRMERLLSLPVSDGAALAAESFLRRFYRPECRLFADCETSNHCSMHANLYAAYFGLLPPEAEDTFESLVLDPSRRCGVLPMYFVLRALGGLGRCDAVYRLLAREDLWRKMLREGAAACFEAWGKDEKWNTSLCHPWASGAIPVIIEELAGVHPAPEEKSGFRFEPHLPDAVRDFTLIVPFRGEKLRISRCCGGETTLERI